MDETRLSRIVDLFSQLGDLGGSREQTKIVPNREVIDDAPAGLANYIIVEDEGGYYIPAVKLPGASYSTGDYVNLLLIQGTEPIALGQGSGSGSAGVPVHDHSSATEGGTFDSLNIGIGANYLEVKSDGEITLHGTARAWKNVELTPDNVGKPSANPPATGEYQGFVFDRYDRATEEQTYFIWVVPEDFATGDANVTGKFQFLVENPPAAVDEAVVLGFEYKKISDGDVFNFAAGTSSGTVTETITAGEAAYLWHYTTYGTCTTTGWAPDDTVLFRFYRDATNVNDTYDNEAVQADNDVWVGVYHLEYLVDKLGEAS